MPDQPDDLEKFELIDDYLKRLQSGQAPDREKFLEEHPELESTLRCLETLEHLAPDATTPFDAESDQGDFPSSGAQLPCDFGPYELIEEIGRGGMGVVFKARQKDLDRTVAVKMILDGHLASPEHVRRFRSEAQAAARAEHSGIVHVHDVGQFHAQHYFAMEYVEGLSLAQWLAKQPDKRLDVESAVRLLESVARAIDHLHQHEIIHRDLKPSNILLDTENRPHVTDFGLAKIFHGDGENTTTGAILGTPSYMAPEQASGGAAKVGPRADIYGLGAILFELLTGQPPFGEDAFVDTVLQVIGGECPLPRTLNPRIPVELELVCLKCLDKDPENRYATAGALADELALFRRGDPLTVRPPSVRRRLLRWTRREPAMTARLAVFFIFFLVENVNYLTGSDGVDWTFHRNVLTLEGLWVLATLGFHLLLKYERWKAPGPFIWGAFDCLMILVLLLLADGVASPLVMLYPMLIVASALWFRGRFVWMVTGLSLLSYGVLAAVYYTHYLGFDIHWMPTKTHTAEFDRPDRHVIFAVGLLGIAGVAAHIVHRVKALSGYFGRRL